MGIVNPQYENLKKNVFSNPRHIGARSGVIVISHVSEFEVVLSINPKENKFIHMRDSVNSSYYTTSFYDEHSQGSLKSATVILGILYENFQPISVVDFGCGVGAWLAAAESLGSKQLTGMDGNWIIPENLMSQSIRFLPTEFSSSFSSPGKFDLALSVEVAEHFECQHAERFVRCLCEASAVVVFGAAIPGQGGVNHVNEQWQSYWIDLFAQRGYECFDLFRPQVWNNQDVDWWYRQNTFLFVSATNSELERSFLAPYRLKLPDIIHPLFLDNRLYWNSKKFQKLRADILEQENDTQIFESLASHFRKDDQELYLLLKELANSHK